MPFAPAWPGVPHFRKLDVTVTPEAIDAAFDDVPLPRLSTADIRKKFELLKVGPLGPDDCPDLRPEFGQVGSLGLYVSRSEVSFRDVVVEPLP